MAKKFEQPGRVSLLVNYLYSHGIFQSFIVNTSILIILTIITNTICEKQLSPIVLSFTKQEETIDNFHELEIIEHLRADDEEEEVEITQNKQINLAIDSVTNNLEKPSLPVMEDIFESDQTAFVNENLSEENILQNIEAKQQTPKPKIIPVSNHRKTGISTDNQTPGVSSPQSSGLADEVLDLDQRLKQYGAKGGDIQVSLSWNSIDDIDLHINVVSQKSTINWTNKLGFCGGMLDIDMNAHPSMLTNRPIENIFWRNNAAPRSLYVVGVHNYMPWSRNMMTEVLVVVKIKGEVKMSKRIKSVYGQGIQEVFRFDY